ncbi:MAG: OmpH family outer membrane protein [Alphaproteobacteria bacterium]|nr:OmpH family outer membrane protein [Alphaproteobacteria bacterium]
MKKVTKKEVKNCFINTLNKPIVLAATAFVLGCLISSIIACCCRTPKIAMVDVAQIVNKSSDIAKVQKNQQQRMQELQEWLTTVQTEITKERNKQKQAELAQKYEEELEQKKSEIQAAYNEEIKIIDEKMTKLITKKAKKKGYKIILTKSSVLAGAKDLTDVILESVK